MRVEKIGNSTLYLGDCRQIMGSFPPSLTVITDPPYGINLAKLSGKMREGLSRPERTKDYYKIYGDDAPFDPAPLLTHKKVILWGGNHFASRLPDSRSWLIWDKREGTTSDNQADCEMAWSNLSGPARLHSQLWRGICRRGEENVALQPRYHPTQKPVALMKWCIALAGTPEIVFDPYMGSGSTGVACVQMGIGFIGVEIDEGHFETACKRIREAYAQPDMFIGNDKVKQHSLLEATP